VLILAFSSANANGLEDELVHVLTIPNRPVENKNLIMQLTLELNKEVFASKAISEIALNLAKIIESKYL